MIWLVWKFDACSPTASFSFLIQTPIDIALWWKRPHAKLASHVAELSCSQTQLDLANSAVEHIFTVFYYNHGTP